MNDEAATHLVFSAEDERFNAMVAGDAATLERILPEDLHYVHANGIIEGKAEFIRKIVSGERTYKQFAPVKREIRREGGFAFVFGEAQVEVVRAAGLLQNNLTYTAIYREAPQPALFAWHAVKAIDA